MGNLLWAIVKDGLKALAFWLVASLVMIWLWGYAGKMLSLLLGMIFIVSFIGLNLKRIVMYFQGRGGAGGGRGNWFPPIQPVVPQPGGPQQRPCPEGTDGWMTCPICSGNGVSMQGGSQPETCIRCNGMRRVNNCTRCNGSGYITF